MGTEWIKQDIADALYKKGIISIELYGKCSKPHITNLPYDNRYTDVDEINERKDVIEEHIFDLLNKIDDSDNKITELTKRTDALNSQINEFESTNRFNIYTFNDRLNSIWHDIDTTEFREDNEFTSTPWMVHNVYDEYYECRKLYKSLDKTSNELYEQAEYYFNGVTKTIPNKLFTDMKKDCKEFKKILKQARKKVPDRYGVPNAYTMKVPDYIIANVNQMQSAYKQNKELRKEYNSNLKEIKKIEKELKEEVKFNEKSKNELNDLRKEHKISKEKLNS